MSGFAQSSRAVLRVLSLHLQLVVVYILPIHVCLKATNVALWWYSGGLELYDTQTTQPGLCEGTVSSYVKKKRRKKSQGYQTGKKKIKLHFRYLLQLNIRCGPLHVCEHQRLIHTLNTPLQMWEFGMHVNECCRNEAVFGLRLFFI